MKLAEFEVKEMGPVQVMPAVVSAVAAPRVTTAVIPDEQTELATEPLAQYVNESEVVPALGV